MRSAVVHYLTESDLRKNNCSSEISVEEYVKMVNRATHFVVVKPANQTLQACFEEGSRGRKSISKNEYIGMMKKIF